MKAGLVSNKAERIRDGWLYGFKILTLARHSPVIPIDLGGRIYHIGRLVRPANNCSPLTVFTDYPHAHSFGQGHRWLIVKCHYKPANLPEDVHIIYNKRHGELRSGFPGGTDFASAVICLE